MGLQFLEHVVLATLAEWDWLWSSIVEYKGQVYGCLTLIATLALAVLYFSHRLTPSRSLLLWRQKRLCFFQWKETNLKTFSPICTADFMHFGSKLRSAATKTSAAATYTDAVPWLSCYRFQLSTYKWQQLWPRQVPEQQWLGSLWGGSSLQSFGRDTLCGFTHHLVLVAEKSSDDQHIFVDTYFIRFFESDASNNPACLFIYIYIHAVYVNVNVYIYIYTHEYIHYRMTKSTSFSQQW